MSYGMTRRDILRRFILSLLAIVLGPDLLRQLDAEEFDALCAHAEQNRILLPPEFYDETSAAWDPLGYGVYRVTCIGGGDVPWRLERES